MSADMDQEEAASNEDAVRSVYERERRAMLDGDAAALGELLAESFTLTHMTGYRQQRAEWLRDVETGQMTYHSMVDVSVDVALDGDTAVVDARTRTEATIWGAHGTWRLQLRTAYEQTPRGWLARETIASTW